MLRLQTSCDVVVERHERIRHRGCEEILVHVAGLQLFVLGRIGLIQAVFQAERELLALRELRRHLLGDVLRCGVVRDGDVEHGFSLGNEVLREMRERVAVRDVDAVAEVAALEFELAGSAGVPREPVMADLEGGAVGEVQLAHLEGGVLRDALAEVRGQIPAAAPEVQQVRGGVVVGVVVVAGEEDAAALAPHHEGIGAQRGVGLGGLGDSCFQRGVGLEGFLTEDERGGLGLERGGDRLVGVCESGLCARHQLDVFHQVCGGLLLPLARCRRDDHGGLGPAGIGNDQIILLRRAGGLRGKAKSSERQGEQAKQNEDGQGFHGFGKRAQERRWIAGRLQARLALTAVEPQFRAGLSLRAPRGASVGCGMAGVAPPTL